MSADVYQIVTDRIVELLEKGVAPWRKPWNDAETFLPPCNLVSGKEYSGINHFLLNACPYENPYWLTYKQAQERGGHVRKGEKGMPVIFWKMYEKEDAQTEDGKRVLPVLRYYTVFNAEQCEDIETPDVPKVQTYHQKPIEEAEAVQLAMPNRPVVEFGGGRAYYSPLADTVRVPEINRYQKREEFYSTLFHELGHATGHESRLCRPGVTEAHYFGDPTYSKEELVAEMTAAFLCAHCRIATATLENSAAYLQGWIKTLKGDKKLAVTAAGQAKKAADYILGKQIVIA